MSLRFAWAFLTRLPGGAHPRHDADLGRSVPWFPLVGALVGALSGAAFWALWSPFGAPLAATAAIATGIALTGGFHEDGLADTTDALGGSTPQERFEIMKDSRLGTFGTLALLLSTLVGVFALLPLPPFDGAASLVLAHGLGRAAAVVVMLTTPSAHGAGLGRSYTAHLRTGPCLAAVLIAYAAAMGIGPAGAVAAGAAGVGALLVGALARRAFGGVTGDVLGAAATIGQLAALVSLSRLIDNYGWTWS